MAARRSVDPRELRAAVTALLPWLRGADTAPPRAELARAVRLSLRTLEAIAPGRSVEVRVPPYAAVQCVSGPAHTRGTPPNVIEMAPRVWLRLACGELDWASALEAGELTASGNRADVSEWLPLLRVDPESEQVADGAGPDAD